MASAKQIAWRKKFARMSKAGKFQKKKSSTKSKSNPHSEPTFSKKEDAIRYIDLIYKKVTEDSDFELKNPQYQNTLEASLRQLRSLLHSI